MDTRLLDLTGLQLLIDALVTRGYTVLGPTEHQGSIVTAPIRAVADLPVGWGDEQEAGHYRLRRREDDKVFGFASGAQSAKPVFFPTETVLWRGQRTADGGFTVEAGTDGDRGPYALLGVRSCDLAAVGIHDRVLLARRHVDDDYAARRADAFVVAVTCSDPSGTCFCVSMGTGPRPAPAHEASGTAYDLLLTELLDAGGHRFVVEVGSDRGHELLDELDAPAASGQDLLAAEEVATVAAGRMGRTLETDGLKELLYASSESPVWDDVASRCLSCTNCTAVCPTCFCTNVEDVTDLAGDSAERHRVWDSCFTTAYSYIHGGSVRASGRSRYRQWMTHKLAAWQDQFATSGCVGCGRCITWCPAAIDITAEAAALRAGSPAARSATSARDG